MYGYYLHWNGRILLVGLFVSQILNLEPAVTIFFKKIRLATRSESGQNILILN